MRSDPEFIRRMLELYIVTDRRWLGNRQLCDQVEQAILGGATCVQLREKNLPHDAIYAEAVLLKRLCSRYGVPLIINDDLDLALASGADGVHVGQSDMNALEVRRKVGKQLIVGVTAKTVQQALEAQVAGADYLGSGAVFGTATKLDARPMTMARLAEIASSVTIPVVAIGGIDRHNIDMLKDTGVAGAAVVSGVFAAEDIRGECMLLRKRIEMWED